MQFAQLKRREFITALGGAMAWPLAAGAQQPAKIARIGFMRAAGPNEKEFNAFRSGLKRARTLSSSSGTRRVSMIV
jgi:hypothetical protein